MISDRLVGAFVFPEAWSDRKRYRELISGLRGFGVNAIVTETDKYDEAAISATHDLGLRFYAGVACFSDHASHFQELLERPELWPILETGERRPQMEWYVGITPTDRRHQREVLDKIQSIAATYAIDGLFLDFIRWPLHWELELRPDHPRPLDSGFDAATLMTFERATGVRLQPESVPVAARSVRERHSREWVDFKCKVISEFVSEARMVLKRTRPAAALGLFYVPHVDDQTEVLTGQRLSDLVPLADFIAPMLYHNILLRPPSWISEALPEIVRVAGSKTLPVAQVDSNRDSNEAGDWGPPMSQENWKTTLAQVGNRADTAGIIAFPGTSLIGNGRGELLRNTLV